MQSVAEGMVEAGHQAVVATTVPQEETRTDWCNGVKVYYVRQKNLYYWPPRSTDNHVVLKPLWHALDTYNPWMAREVEHILEVEQPDVVHTSLLAGFSVSVWNVVKQHKLPLVHTLFDYYLLCPRATMFRNGKNCKRQCTECRPYSLPRRALSKQVDAMVGTSRFILDRHLELGCFAATPTKMEIYNAYQTELSTRSPAWSTSGVRFGYLGRLHPTKGIESLLQAVDQLPTGSWNLKVAGRGSEAYERHLRTKYELPAVEFLGHVKPEEYLREIDVLVVPSVWHDPSPRVVSEAYAYGVPVIGSNTGGIPELVEEGRTGFLFDPSSPTDLAAKMRWFVDDSTLVGDMRVECLKRAENVTHKKVNEQYIEAYVAAMKAG